MNNQTKTKTQAAGIPRKISLNRTSLSIVLLFLSWPVVLVHRFWNNRPPLVLDLIAYEKVEQDIQWYIKDTGDLVSVIFLLSAFYLHVQSTRMKIAVGSFLLISIIDIGHYWLWYKRNEYVVQFEFIILIVAAILMAFKFKRNAQKR